MPPIPPSPPPTGRDEELLQHLLGFGERTACMRLALDTDWAATSVGAVGSWPVPLQSALSTAMTSKFPMLVMAGPDLTMVYNDGYAPILGDRHPAAMGRPLAEVWSDVWPSIAPMIDAVVEGQQANYFQDLELTMTRNGYDEQTFWTFSYSPLLDGTGAVLGLLDTVLETTGQVVAARRLELAQRAAAVAGQHHADLAAACTAVLAALDGAPDIARAGIYLLGQTSGNGPRMPQVFGLPAATARKLESVVTGLSAGQLGEDLADLWGDDPLYGSPSPVARSVAVPLLPAGAQDPVGALVVRTHQQLPVDEPYRVALRLVAAQVATALGNARVNADAARSVRLLESMSGAFYSLDADLRFAYLNAPAEALIGIPREQAVGQPIWDLFPAAEHSEIGRTYRHVLATGHPATFTAHYPAPLDAWFDIRVSPDAGGLSVFFLDVTERTRAQQRTELLAQVTAELTGMLDAEDAVARLAELVVPQLGDWCLVTVVAGDQQEGGRRSLRDVGAWHADPELLPLVRRYADTRIDALTDRSFVAQALSSGETVQADTDAAERIRAVLHPGEAADLIGELAPQGITVLPMRGRGRISGLLTLFAGADRAPLSGADLAAAEDIAGRAGLALDNARLYTEQAGLAATLQRSLLTDPPEPDHAQIVVRYVPATEAAQVGGDWYDAFLQHDGATMIVIGDVAGHDTAAAATMGQIRGLLRGIATSSGAGPAEVLSRLDSSIQLLQIDTLATAAIARFEQTPEEVERGVTRMIWANAGHPPPIVLDPDGTHHVLASGRAQLLLGVHPDTTRTEQVTTLDRDATVLLYTDGLLERRDADLDTGLDRLTQAITDLAHTTLDELCDGIIQRMVNGKPDDDVALVAVRLHRQDHPRPHEAGPQNVPDGTPRPAHPAQ